MTEAKSPQLEALVERHNQLRRAAEHGREQYQKFELEQAKSLLRARENAAAMERFAQQRPAVPVPEGRPTIDAAVMNRRLRIGDRRRPGLLRMVADLARDR